MASTAYGVVELRVRAGLLLYLSRSFLRTAAPRSARAMCGAVRYGVCSLSSARVCRARCAREAERASAAPARAADDGGRAADARPASRAREPRAAHVTRCVFLC